MIKYILAVVILAGGLFGVYSIYNSPSVDIPNTQVTVTATTTGQDMATVTSGTVEATVPAAPVVKDTKKTDTPTEKSFTLAEVQANNSKESCHSAINGNVYDLTSWIDKHPGGSLVIIFICGKDGTKGFLGKHASSDKAKAALARYKIGVLAQ